MLFQSAPAPAAAAPCSSVVQFLLFLRVFVPLLFNSAFPSFFSVALNLRSSASICGSIPGFPSRFRHNFFWRYLPEPGCFWPIFLVAAEPIKTQARHIELLDYIRAAAILLVMADHTLSNLYGNETLPWAGWFRDLSGSLSPVFFLPFNPGMTGVAVFFFVSGFCIHTSFHQQGQKWGAFFIRRFFRIYPPYLAALILFTVFTLQAPHLSYQHQHVSTRYGLEIVPPTGLFWVQVLTHLFLVHNFLLFTFSGITGAFWSLAVEAQLYLLYPALLIFVARWGWRRTLVLLAAVELCIRGADGVTQTMDASLSVGGFISGVLARSPLGYWFSWALGAFVADAVLKREPLPFLKTSLFGWLFLMFGCYYFRPLDPFCFMLAALMTAMVASKLLGGARPAITLPGFCWRILGKIGLWSYSIYLIHQQLLIIYTHAINRMVPAAYRSVLMEFLVTLAGWLIILLFSVLWRRWLEVPGIACGKRIIGKLEQRNAAVPKPDRIQAVPRSNRLGLGLSAMTFLLLVIASLWMNASLKPRAVERNNLAWSLATNPDAAQRNGALAVKLAEQACAETGYQKPVLVGTLAAAYAEAGRFDDAVATAEKAMEMASQAGNQALFERNRQLLALYQNHQAYRESR